MNNFQKKEKEADDHIPNAHHKELDQRLKSYSNNPDELLDWKDIKQHW